METGLQEVVRQTLVKSSRTNDKLRRSFLGYLDAAVTSVSSAAVASAQAMAVQLADILRDTTAAINVRLDKVRSYKACSSITAVMKWFTRNLIINFPALY